MKNALRHWFVLALLCVALPTSAQAPEPQEPPQAPEQLVPPSNVPLPPEQVPSEPEPVPDEPVPDEPVPDPVGTDTNPDSADGPQAPGDAAEDPDELGDEHRPLVELRVSDGEVYTGDVVTVTLTALAPALDDISVPSEQDVAPFEILDTDVRTEERPEGVLHTFTLELLALEPGEHILAPFRVRVLTPDGVIGHVETEPLTIRVGSVLGNEPNAEPRPPTQPVPLLEEDPTLYWVGGALLLILLTALFTWVFARWWRAREKAAAPPPPPRPPEDIALEKLNALRQRRDAMLREGQGVEFVDHVSDAVREYLGHRFSFEGLESTTDEVLARMRKRKLRGVGIEEIAGLLQDCDLVKFAKADFTLDQSELLLTGSFRIVRATTNAMPAPQPMAPAAAAAAAAAAPKKEPVQTDAEARWMPKAAPVQALEEEPPAAEPQAAAQATEAHPAPPALQAEVSPVPSTNPIESAAVPTDTVVDPPRSIPDTVPPGSKAAAVLAAAAEEASSSERPIPDTIPPMAPSSGDDQRSADTLRGLAFDAEKVAQATAETEREEAVPSSSEEGDDV
ncbi:MAG: hypothetical protein ACI9KE_002483 [Polyangiales bacterium]|jgi:hypothetical protein